MNRRHLILILLAFACLPWLSCRSSRSQQNEISAFIDRYEKKAAYMHRQIECSMWEFYTRGQSDSLEYFSGLKNIGIPTLEDLQEIRKREAGLGDTKEHRQLEIIYSECLREALDNTPDIQRLLVFLGGAAGEFQPVFEGRRMTNDSLEMLLAADPDSNRRRDAYLASIAVGGVLADGIASLARLRNQAAVRAGYADYHEAMLAGTGLGKSEFQEILGELDKLSAEPYRKSLDSFKSLANIGEFHEWDAPYGFRKISDQFNDDANTAKRTHLLEATLAGMGFKLKALPIYYDSAMGPGGDNAPSIYPVHFPGDIRLLIGRSGRWLTLEKLFGLTGRALYATQIDQRDYLLARPSSPCLEAAADAFFGSLVGSDAWLRKYAALPDPQVLELTSLQEFHRLYEVRLLLLKAAFEYALYQNPAADLNQVYRDLSQKYLLFSPPPEVYPWAADPDYIFSPGHKADDLFGACIAAQLYQFLIKKYGSVLDNQRTRDFLTQNIFRPGARDDWHDLLSRATGEKLRPAYYFMATDD